MDGDCASRLADDSRQSCVGGGIPKPLFGELVGDISAEIVGGTSIEGVRAVRFERGFPCDIGASEVVDEAPMIESVDSTGGSSQSGELS